MQARIANRLRAKKGTLPPNVAPLIDFSNQGASSVPKGRSSGNLGDSSVPIEPTLAISPVPSPVRATTASRFLVRKPRPQVRKWIQMLALNLTPPNPLPRKLIQRGRRPLRVLANPRSKGKAGCGKAEEAENLKLVAELTEWWKGARTELRPPKCVSVGMEGEKLVPDWAISAQSSKQLEESNKLRTAAEERAKQLEAQLEDLTLRSRIEVNTARTVALEAGKKESFSAGCLAGKTEGLKEGHEVYLASEEHKEFVKQTRLQGARDFLKAPAFNVAVEIKATEFLDQGFERCKSQVLKLKGFTEGFDLSWLDPTLDGNLVAFPEDEVPPPVDDEFESLIEEVEKMDAPLGT
ncbi:hypothetical protein Salat_2395200 [Sesamum alatum]|uniref:Uncharacterized protein n=1 Tax=Sesamum alatum TaxID=300844 RepID=A0AAE2CF52_9LAMI|nr:hypothetical protein Salat_2395200 [Sesamum alatum]